MSSDASIMNTGNSSIADGAANTRPDSDGNSFAALAVNVSGPDIHGDGVATGTLPPRPPAVAAAIVEKTVSTNKQPFPPVDYTKHKDRGSLRVHAWALIDHPTDPDSRTPAIKFYTNDGEHSVSCLQYRGGQWRMVALGTLKELVESGDVQVYCTPSSVFPFGTFGEHNISFFQMLGCAMSKMSKDGITRDFATALKEAKSSGKSIILDKGVLSIRGSGIKKIPKKGKSKATKDATGWTLSGTKADAQKLKDKVKSVASAAAGPSTETPKPTSHPGDGNNKHFAIAKGHSIGIEFDGSHYFTLKGKRISKAALIKRGFIVTRTPEGGAIVMPKLEDADLRQKMKLQLMRECLLYNIDHGTEEEKEFARTALDWKTIFIAKVDGKFKWVESLPQKSASVDSQPGDAYKAKSRPPPPTHKPPAAPVKTKADVPEKTLSFAAMAAKAKPNPPAQITAAQMAMLEHETESEDESEVTEAFPGLPQMTAEQKAKQEADKLAYLAKVKDELAKSQSTPVVSEAVVPEPAIEEIPVPVDTSADASAGPGKKGKKGRKNRPRALTAEELGFNIGLFN